MLLVQDWRKSLTLCQTMSVWPNMCCSRPGGNCCVQSMTAGLKRPQQRSWKKETRFRTTPRLQQDTQSRNTVVKKDTSPLAVNSDWETPATLQKIRKATFFRPRCFSLWSHDPNNTSLVLLEFLSTFSTFLVSLQPASRQSCATNIYCTTIKW